MSSLLAFMDGVVREQNRIRNFFVLFINFGLQDLCCNGNLPVFIFGSTCDHVAQSARKPYRILRLCLRMTNLRIVALTTLGVGASALPQDDESTDRSFNAISAGLFGAARPLFVFDLGRSV